MGEKTFWANDAGGRMYMIKVLDGDLLELRGPLPSILAHIPELILLVYAAVVFAEIWLGYAHAALALMAAVIPIVLLSVMVPRLVLERKQGAKARLLGVSGFTRKAAIISIEYYAKREKLELYAAVKSLPRSLAEKLG